jgi:hypothetical protein
LFEVTTQKYVILAKELICNYLPLKIRIFAWLLYEKPIKHFKMPKQILKEIYKNQCQTFGCLKSSSTLRFDINQWGFLLRTCNVPLLYAIYGEEVFIMEKPQLQF